MRFTSVIIAGLMAVAQAQDATTSAPDSTTSSGLTDEVQQCIKKCSPDDVNCIAHCTPVPSPDDGNLEALHDCVDKCDQGSGSEEDTTAYGNCVSDCVVKNYYDPEQGTPGQGQSGSGSSGSNDDDDSDDDDDSSSDSGSDSDKDGDDKDGDSEDSESSDSSDGDDDSAAAGLFASPLVALFGVAAAVLAF